MRDIKFRGKKIDNGEWVYGFYGYKEETNEHFIMVETVNLHSTSYFTDYEVDPETVGQYTGLRDRNGKGIYEGDILKTKRGVFPVVRDKYQFALEGYYCPSNDIPHDYFSEQGWDEVIGNIYENGELLHDKK